MSEPGLSAPLDVSPGSTVVAVPPAKVRTVTWVDRHPLFAKPREVYDTTNNPNPVIKTAAATVIGVPRGIVGEVRQIVEGAPPGSY